MAAVKAKQGNDFRRVASAGGGGMDDAPALQVRLLSPSGASRLAASSPGLPRQESLRYRRQISAPTGDEGRSGGGENGRGEYRRMNSAHLDSTGGAAGSRLQREIKIAPVPVLVSPSASNLVTPISPQERALMRMKSLDKIPATDASSSGAASPRNKRVLHSWESTAAEGVARTVASPRAAQVAPKPLAGGAGGSPVITSAVAAPPPVRSQQRSMSIARKRKRENWLMRWFHRHFGLRGVSEEVELSADAKQLVEELKFPDKHVRQLRAMFNDIDLDGSGTVDCDEFLSLIDIERSPFTDKVFQIVGQDAESVIGFSALLMIILKYCLFNKEQILAFCFRMYDTDGSGSIDEQEFMDLLHTVNNASPIFPGNFQRALDEFDVNKDGLIDFDEFRELDKRYPLVFFPAYKLQDAMQRRCLGENSWIQIRQDMRKRELIEEFKRTHGGKAPDDKTLKQIIRDNRRT